MSAPRFLTKHFTLEELCVTTRREIKNDPTPAIIENLQVLANALEVIRSLLGKPLIVSSGYRCPELNKAIGGSKNSRHMLGLAADFVCPQAGSVKHVALTIRDSDIPFDQLILETPTPHRQWVHFGIEIPGTERRREVLTLVAPGVYVQGISN